MTTFLEAYRRELLAHYSWASDPYRLAKFMASVEATLRGAGTWHHISPVVTLAWRAIGEKSRPTLTGLRRRYQQEKTT